MSWTDEQQKVIDTRDNNMLVSAAAGSGKTAVLVERIISKILDESNPVDVDRILVVTFTTAAASEMKERVRKAIDKAIMENPERADIRRQGTLIHNAQIRTIDSFCSWVVKNYFYEIDQDPAFRIGTKGELDMLKDEVISELIAQRLENSNESFKALADAYIDGRKVENLKKKVFGLYDKAMSFPWPMEWYDHALDLYNVSDVSQLEDSDFVMVAKERVKQSLSAIVKDYRLALSYYYPDKDTSDKQVLLGELALCEQAFASDSFDDIWEICAGASFVTFAPKNKKSIPEDDIDEVIAIRKRCKGNFLSMRDKYLSQKLEDIFSDLTFVKGQASALIDLAKDYTAALLAVKKKRNIYEFSDIEHMALEILRDADTSGHGRRPVAIELSGLFEEVMVDEYQDSNDLQEWILTAVCRENNYFTVGDVKQSIYAFRQASPKLFMEKFKSYAAGAPQSVRIDLDRNFRSRHEVLDICNDIFRPLMQEDMGNVAYDQAAELKTGATYYPDNSDNDDAEILIANCDPIAMDEVGISSNGTFEAQMVADKIKELIKDGFQVTCDNPDNKDEKMLRPVKYSDIVILMRSTKSGATDFLKVLEDNNIPAYIEEETGFFDRDEIQTVLSMLEVVDNPFNDVPLAAVLHSPMFGLDSEHIAKIRCTNPEVNFFQCAFEYANSHPEDEKVARFINILTELRSDIVDTPIHEIVCRILEQTGYGTYVSALPMGEMAAANLNKLVDEAISFEGTSYQGLSRFVSYINDLKSYDEELGLAKTVGENDVAVRIMTIHKSKGLEFPVVFLCRCGNGFNNQPDVISYHDSLGLGMDYRNPVTRVAYDTIFANIVKDRIRADSRGEEQRVLYVALTRAKEKLFITGIMKPTKDDAVGDIIARYSSFGESLSYEIKEKSSCYLEWILRSLAISRPAMKKTIVNAAELTVNNAIEAAEMLATKAGLQQLANIADESSGRELYDRLQFTYDKYSEEEYKSKYSVSEIKHQAMEDNFGFSEDAAPAFLHEDTEGYIPDFMRTDLVEQDSLKEHVPAGALYGTAMHRFMECYDFSREDYDSSFDEQLEYMTSSGMLPPDQRKLINIRGLRAFVSSDTGKRMHAAAFADGLYKEQPFVFGALPGQLFGSGEVTCDISEIDSNIDDMVLVQGIIDVFFKEEDGVVLLDYKTDRVDEASELVLRYEKQLRLYENAIERGLNVKVKDVLIYSFSLNQTISIGV